MNLSDYCAAQRGRMTRLAKALGLAPAHLSQIAAGDRPIPVRLAARIERETERLVTRQEMFPQEWQDIWPELSVLQAAAVPGSDPTEEGVRLGRRTYLREALVAGITPDTSGRRRDGAGRRETDRLSLSKCVGPELVAWGDAAGQLPISDETGA